MVHLHEFIFNTTNATYVQTFAVPSDYTVDPRPIIPSMNATLNVTKLGITMDTDSQNTVLTIPYVNFLTDYHGQLDRTIDTRYIMFAGYNASIRTNTSIGTTNISRIIAIMDYNGNITFTAAIKNISWAPYNVVSDYGQRYWVAAGKSGGYHIPANFGDKSIGVQVFVNEYRSFSINAGGLYASRPSVQIQQFGTTGAFLPVGMINDDTAVGTPTFLDTRGQAWRTSTELWVVDVAQGLMKLSRFGTSWNKAGPYKAGNVYQFLDCTFNSAGTNLLLVTNTSLYSFTVASNTFTNNNQPLATALPGTTWRGISLSPWVPPSATPSPTPTRSVSSTPSPSRTASSTPSASPTPTCTGTGTASMTPTALATIDYAGIVRLANEQSAQKRTEVGLITGGALGGVVLLVGAIYMFKAYQQKQLKLKRLRKLQNSAELARLGPTSMLSNARLTTKDNGGKYIGGDDDDLEIGVGGPSLPNNMVMYQLGPNKAALTSTRSSGNTNSSSSSSNGPSASKTLTGRGHNGKGKNGSGKGTTVTANPLAKK